MQKSFYLVIAMVFAPMSQAVISEVGPFYSNDLSGIVFLYGDNAAFRIKFGATEWWGVSDLVIAPDKSFTNSTWKEVNDAKINLQWGRIKNGSVLGLITSDREVRFSITTRPSWSHFKTLYRLDDPGVSATGWGMSFSDQMGPVILSEQWQFRHSTADFNITHDKEPGYVAGFFLPKNNEEWTTVTFGHQWQQQPGNAEKGYGWYLTRVILPAEWRGYGLEFHLGAVYDDDWTYFNGQLIGTTPAADGLMRIYYIWPGTKAYDAIKWGSENVLISQIRQFKSGSGGLVQFPGAQNSWEVPRDKDKPRIYARKVSEPVSWRFAVDQKPQDKQVSSEGNSVELFFDLHPDQPLRFAAGTGDLPDLSSADAVIAKARGKYESVHAQASGAWGDFVSPIYKTGSSNVLYNTSNGCFAHTISRGWCFQGGLVMCEWDCFFSALLSSIEDPKAAQNTVRAVLATQQPNGLVPNYSRAIQSIASTESRDRSQPSVGSMCVWKVYQRWPDTAFLAEVYPKLVKWHQWWFTPRPSNGLPYRDGNRNGLLSWGSETGEVGGCGLESGLDDSPHWDNMEADPNSKCMKLDAVDVSALWAADAMYLAYMADELNKPDDAASFRKDRDDMAKRINELLWNEELGIYCDRIWGKDGQPGEFSTKISPLNFYPMIAGIPSKAQAKRMFEILCNPEKLWGHYICPTISRDDPAYPKEHYWRGKIWAPTNYIMYQGLKNYAPDWLRADFARKSVDLFMHNWARDSRSYENYWNSGKGDGPGYVWGPLLCLIGVEEMCDLQPDGSLRLNGLFTEQFAIKSLPFGGKLYDVKIGAAKAALYDNGRNIQEVSDIPLIIKRFSENESKSN
jgi:hypothetical protein